MGISKSQIDAIKAGQFNSDVFSARELSLFELTRIMEVAEFELDAFRGAAIVQHVLDEAAREA